MLNEKAFNKFFTLSDIEIREFEQAAYFSTYIENVIGYVTIVPTKRNILTNNYERIVIRERSINCSEELKVVLDVLNIRMLDLYKHIIYEYIRKWNYIKTPKPNLQSVYTFLTNLERYNHSPQSLRGYRNIYSHELDYFK